MTLGVFLFIAAILIVVMIHESGHFFVARAFGFKATKFFVGFGPTLWSTTRGETEYGVKALPLGGFVKIVGMNPFEAVDPEDEPRSYANKPHWQKALVLVAGSATHFVVGFLILLVASMTIGFPTDEPTTQIAGVQATVDGFPAPAVGAGFESGDRVVAIDGEPAETWDDISSYIKAHPGETVIFEVRRDDGTVELEATLGEAIFDADGAIAEFAPPGEDVREPRAGETVGGFLGVAPETAYEQLGFISAVTTAADLTWYVTTQSVSQIDDVFTLGAFREQEEGQQAVGIVGAGRIAGESVERGSYLRFVELIVFLTIFLGIMNLLPLPPLDGGHLAVVAYEAITKRTVDMRKLIPVAAAVIAFFMILFVVFLYRDIANFSVPF